MYCTLIDAGNRYTDTCTSTKWPMHAYEMHQMPIRWHDTGLPRARTETDRQWNRARNQEIRTYVQM